MSECPLCHTDVEDVEDAGGLMVHVMVEAPDMAEVRLVHRECMLRSVMGGIGHLEDHDFWCEQMHDPDGGLSYRESALKVAKFMEEHDPRWN